MSPIILVAGASGFLGRAVFSALSADARNQVRVLLRDPVPRRDAVSFRADLTRPETLREPCEGVDVVVHAASYVGPDADLCDRVNRVGTRNLLDAATRAGVRRFLYLGTAAVYGNGPHEDTTTALRPAPVSAVSRSRLAAEEAVLDRGGLVLRPHLVHGPGDRWFIPTLLRVVDRIGGLVGSGDALLSTVAVDRLAAAVAGLVRRGAPPGVLNACHPEPTTVREVLEVAARHLDRPLRTAAVSRVDAVRATGDERRVVMLSEHHWYRSSEIWSAAACDPGPPFPADFARHAGWYRAHLSGPHT